jgi:hypothetical protein
MRSGAPPLADMCGVRCCASSPSPIALRPRDASEDAHRSAGMALIDSRKFWIGLAIGVAATSLRRRKASTLARGLRSIFKVLIKAGVAGSERGRDLVAFVREAMEDAAAEVRSEAHAAASSRASMEAADADIADAADRSKASAGRKRVGSA